MNSAGKRRRVFIWVPSSDGRMNTSTAVTLVQSTQSRRFEIAICSRAISLLANNFNSIFCESWNRGAHYCVILHSDVSVDETQPPDGTTWIDSLLLRMEATEAALLSMILPIKNHAGVCSAGMLVDPSNPYSVRRLTTTEAMQLPADLITRLDVCKVMGLDPRSAGAMLFNTGLLVMNLGGPGAPDWKPWTGFCIRDCIGFNKSNKADNRCEPEDWGLSRFAWEQGWRVYQTRSPRCLHAGIHHFGNNEIWGEPVDQIAPLSTIEQYEKTVEPGGLIRPFGSLPPEFHNGT